LLFVAEDKDIVIVRNVDNYLPVQWPNILGHLELYVPYCFGITWPEMLSGIIVLFLEKEERQQRKRKEETETKDERNK